jgi:deoxyinosine 3'endonuclease (endonuclease V)
MMKTTETIKAILGGVWRLGRGTATVMGLAVLLALTVGVASTALAGTGVGARFDLGTTNTVNAVSKLVGTVVGPSLTIDNNSTGTGATALDL